MEGGKAVRTVVLGFAVLGASLAACRAPRAATSNVADREEATAATAAFRRDWLAPAHIAPPTATLTSQSASDGPLVVTVTPAFPEAATWNDWPGPEARLFNNRGGLMFEVAITGPGPARWVPERSVVRVNAGDVVVPAAATADELLVPLLGAALEAERHLVESDLVDRTRAAGPFRSAYLATAPGDPPLGGVVIFPLPDPDAQVVGLDLVIAVETADGERELTFAWN